MTPELLEQYLKVMQANGVMQADLAVPWTQNEDGTMATLRMCFTLAPNHEPLPGETPTPGGWKGPTHLDEAFDAEKHIP